MIPSRITITAVAAAAIAAVVAVVVFGGDDVLKSTGTIIKRPTPL